MCDKFDGDGTLSHQPGIMPLCADLLKTPSLAEEFWELYQRDELYGVVSLWNTALEYFPYNFNALSILSAGLAEAGKDSVINVSIQIKLYLIFYATLCLKTIYTINPKLI